MAQAPRIDQFGAAVELNMPPALLSFQAALFATQTHAACVVTADADSARPNTIRQVHGSYSAAPTAGSSVKIEDGSGNTVWQMYIASGGPFSFSFEMPKSGSVNTALVVTLSDGGAGIIGSLYADIYRHL